MIYTTKVFSYKDLIFNEQWTYRNPVSGFVYRNGIIPGTIFFSEMSGTISDTDIQGVLQSIDILYSQSDFKNRSITRIIDYSGADNPERLARRSYSHAFNQINCKYNFQQDITIISGANPVLRVLQQLYCSLLKTTFLFTNNISDSFDIINSCLLPKNHSFTDEFITLVQNSSDVISLFGNHQQIHSLNNPSPSDLLPIDNPLYQLKMLLDMIAQDIAEMQKDDLEQIATLEQILETVQAGIVIVHHATHIIRYVNPAAASIAGLLPEMIVGKDCHQFICPNSEGMCLNTDHAKDIYKRESILLRDSGEKIPILKSVIPLKYRGEDTLLETFIDISHIRKVESELQESKNTLEWHNQFLRLLSKISSELAGASSDKVDTTIQGAIESIGLFVKSDIVLLFKESGILNTQKASYEWYGDEEELRKIKSEDIINWLKELFLTMQSPGQMEEIYIPDTEITSTDLTVKVTSLTGLEIKSLLLLPFVIGNTGHNFLIITSLQKKIFIFKR